MPVSSKALGISGECDIVEFYRQDEGIKLHGHKGFYGIYPIEYKKGSPKQSEEDVLQLTAQVLCLEEMFLAEIPEGALFYGETRRRETIVITEELRQRVKCMVVEMHQYYNRKYTPRVKYGKYCNACSLKEKCMPKLGKTFSVKKYMEQTLEDAE